MRNPVAIVISQDETILAETICLLLYVGCPRNTQIVFQCGQFATMCLERIQICDGFRDCESGFDESTEICSGSMSTDTHNIMVLIAHEIGATICHSNAACYGVVYLITVASSSAHLYLHLLIWHSLFLFMISF